MADSVWVRWSKTRTRSVSMKAAAGTPTGSRSGSGTGRLEGRHRVIGERPDGAAGEAGHPLGRLDAAAWHERADGGQRIGDGARLDRQVGGVDGHRHRPGLDPGDAVAHLEQAAWPDAQERIATEPLAALDRFEQVGGVPVVEPEEGADGGLEVRRARGAQQDRVGVGGEALGLRQADRIGCRHRGWPRRIKNDLRLRDERSCLPRCHPHSAMPHSRDRRVVHVSVVTDRRCPVSLALCAGAYWRPRLAPPRVRSGGSRVHPPSSSFRLAPTAGSLGRRRDEYSSRSQPAVRDVRGVWTGRVRGVKRSTGSPDRRPAERPAHAVRRHRSGDGRPAARRPPRAPGQGSRRARAGPGPTGRGPAPPRRIPRRTVSKGPRSGSPSGVRTASLRPARPDRPQLARTRCTGASAGPGSAGRPAPSSERSQRQNTDPRRVSIRRPWRHASHKPGGGAAGPACGRSARVAHRALRMAERVGFEPTKSFDSALFKSAAINRSATSPCDRISREPSGSPASCPGWAAQGCLTTIVPAMRSCQPRRRLSMKIQM